MEPLRITLCLVALLSTTVSATTAQDYPFRNTSLPFDQRVDDLVSRLTLPELQLQMAKGGVGVHGGPAPAIARLGIGPYQWDTECLDGDVQAPGIATGYPAPIGISAAFSRELTQSVATATSEEVRGKHNEFAKQGIYKQHTSASCFSPVVNIARDPRWGRNQETFGEDPFLSGELGQYFIKGLRGNHPRFYRATAVCKHFDVHGGPESIPVSRMSFDANVTMEDWQMSFLPAFKACVKGGTLGIMCSYNSINGVPACANKQLLTTILREELGFDGYVVSDEGAVENIITAHKYLKTKVDAAAACVNAGLNLELSGNEPDAVFMHIEQAVNEGKITESQVRELVKPLFYTRMRLGEFDPPSGNPYAALGNEQVETPEHKKLAVRAAQMTYVLLKNDFSLLPLKEGQYKNVAMIGPMSDNVKQLYSDYPAEGGEKFALTPLKALAKEYPSIKLGAACADLTPCTKYDASVVPATVKNADLVFVALGTGKAVEREACDRPDVNLPGYQKQLLLDVINSNPSAEIVLLLFNAGPLNITFADEHSRVKAIMECFFPAQGTGEALVNVLFNKDRKSSPAGRLTMTWPRYADQVPQMVNYSMVDRTYRYSTGEGLYPFGYGLSYSEFRYSNLTAPQRLQSDLPLSGSFVVQNYGPVDSDEVVQCYFGPTTPQPHPIPLTSLVYFDRVPLQSGQEVTVKFSIEPEAWSVWKNNKWIFPTMDMTLSCGGGQKGKRGAKTVSQDVQLT